MEAGVRMASAGIAVAMWNSVVAELLAEQLPELRGTLRCVWLPCGAPQARNMELTSRHYSAPPHIEPHSPQARNMELTSRNGPRRTRHGPHIG